MINSLISKVIVVFMKTHVLRVYISCLQITNNYLMTLENDCKISLGKLMKNLNLQKPSMIVTE